MAKIPVLFCQQNSIYKTLGFDCYDLERNAFSYPGRDPVICHPPCRKFSRLYKLSTAPTCERLLGMYAVALVRRNGGIVEQPHCSKLWKCCGIERTIHQDQHGGILVSVNQHWFGFPCEKKTDLYIVGIDRRDIPAPPLNFNAVTHSISGSKTGKKELYKSKWSYTTESFASYLAQIITLISAGNLNR